MSEEWGELRSIAIGTLSRPIVTPSAADHPSARRGPAETFEDGTAEAASQSATPSLEIKEVTSFRASQDISQSGRLARAQLRTRRVSERCLPFTHAIQNRTQENTLTDLREGQ